MPIHNRAKLPAMLRHRYDTLREFKAAKRRELDAALKALNEFQHGCAHIPPEAYAATCAALRTLRGVRRQLTVQEWGR